MSDSATPWTVVRQAPLSMGILQARILAAKLLQLCPTLCDPIDGSPPGSSVPGILQARILEWVAISFSKEYWSGLLFRFPRDLPNPETEPRSPALQADSLPPEPPRLGIK